MPHESEKLFLPVPGEADLAGNKTGRICFFIVFIEQHIGNFRGEFSGFAGIFFHDFQLEVIVLHDDLAGGDAVADDRIYID